MTAKSFITISASILISLNLCWNRTNAQEVKDFDTIAVVTGDMFVLNSVNRTNLANGKNRNSMVYALPQNLKYALLRVLIDNSDFQIDKKNYQSLMSKFTSVANNQYLLLTGAMLIESVSPQGSGKACDFYLPTTQEDRKKFIEDGHPWKYKIDEVNFIENYTRLNTQSFVIIINAKDLQNKEQLLLAFQNHSLTSSCKVIIDIIAFVEKR